MFAPIFEAAAVKHPDVVFGKVDTEAQPELAATFQIRSIPTIMAFRDGILVFAQAGMLPSAALDELIRKVQALDMDVVREKVRAAEKKRPAGTSPTA
jgi:thioredoxin 1